MKKLMALSLFLSSMAVADINLDIQLNVADKTIQKRCVFNQETQVWQTTEDDITVEAFAKSEGDEVMMDIKVFRKNEQGEAVLMSNPTIKTEWGKTAEIKLENEKGEQLSLQVVATR